MRIGHINRRGHISGRHRQMDDPYNLQRFVEAQNGIYEQVCSELREGRKRGHWMWFIFPQVRGLGRSGTAQFFAISSKEEAQAYLSHPILGPRLRECTRLVTQVNGRSIEQIFGYPDHLKFRSSMTLFGQVVGDNQVFMDALKKYCGGELDHSTLQCL
jgi:uncharacterized protein (DUF1810 family)